MSARGTGGAGRGGDLVSRQLLAEIERAERAAAEQTQGDGLAGPLGSIGPPLPGAVPLTPVVRATHEATHSEPTFVPMDVALGDPLVSSLAADQTEETLLAPFDDAQTPANLVQPEPRERAPEPAQRGVRPPPVARDETQPGKVAVAASGRPGRAVPAPGPAARSEGAGRDRADGSHRDAPARLEAPRPGDPVRANAGRLEAEGLPGGAIPPAILAALPTEALRIEASSAVAGASPWPGEPDASPDVGFEQQPTSVLAGAMPVASREPAVSGAIPVSREKEESRSLLIRVVSSVVSAVPRAIRAALDVTGGQRVASPDEALAELAPKPQAPDPAAWRELRTAPLLDGIPNESLREALVAGEAMLWRGGRDLLVPLAGWVALVRSGQVALALFDAEVLRDERRAADELDRAAQGGGHAREKARKRDRKRRADVGPLIEQAQRNLASFEEGDVVELDARFAEHGTLAAYSVTPVDLVLLKRERVLAWKNELPFMADRLRRANQAARARLDATDGARSLVADFFIRHGLSVSQTLRVRKIEACIECGACEKACEERYGVKRLALNGRILGGLDFVDACHTCTDQRCIDPCNFDAINYDTKRKEILIKEDACTGCTLCAIACPYQAIEMHELDDRPRLKLRLEKAGALAFGDGTARKARLRRIASKCDHCTFYDDQACISACPTGALIEVLPSDVVGQLPAQARAIAKAGFDRSNAINIAALNQPVAFVQGLELPELGRARGPRAKLLMGLWWTVGTLALLLGAAEIALRKLLPEYSAGYHLLTLVEGIEPEIARMRMDYRPGTDLAVDFGYAGTLLMISGLAYVGRRRFSFMRTWGSLRAWFDWHVMTGVVGPGFILMHSAAKLDNWVSIAFWSMVLTVISGLLGRYLTTELPERASTAMMETLEEDRKLGELRARFPGVRAADVWLEQYRKKVSAWDRRRLTKESTGVIDKASVSKEKRRYGFWGGVATFCWVVVDDLGRGRRLARLKRTLRQKVRGKGAWSARRKARRAAERLALLERRRVLLPHLEPLFRHWKAIHIPMAVVLTIVAAIHITLALSAG